MNKILVFRDGNGDQVFLPFHSLKRIIFSKRSDPKGTFYGIEIYANNNFTYYLDLKHENEEDARTYFYNQILITL